MNQETLPLTAFHVMAKPRGAICNLGCRYCFYLDKEELYPGAGFRMSPEVQQAYIRQMIAGQRGPEVTVAWQGGEPTLMGLDFFQRAVELEQQYRRPGMTIHNTFQTNGILLDEEWGHFLHANKFLVGISLDGPQQLHDVYRVDKGGRPTFERVMAGLDILKKHRVEFNILTCVHAANAGYPLEVYRFLRDQAGVKFIQFIPIVERAYKLDSDTPALITNRSVSGAQYGKFLIAIFDEWVQQDVGEIFVQIFDVALGVWYGQRAGLCIFDQTCGQALALEHNGDVYACDHFVEPGYLLGNMLEHDLSDLVISEPQRRFGQAKRDTLPRYCQECEVRFVCNGGCPKDRVLRTPDGEPGLNYLCAGYRAFFNQIDAPMKIMAALLRTERAPAHIMRLLGEKPARDPQLQTRSPDEDPAVVKSNQRGRRKVGRGAPAG